MRGIYPGGCCEKAFWIVGGRLDHFIFGCDSLSLSLLSIGTHYSRRQSDKDQQTVHRFQASPSLERILSSGICPQFCGTGKEGTRLRNVC